MALRISGTASEVAAYLATLGGDVEVTLIRESALVPAAKVARVEAVPAKKAPGVAKSKSAKAAPAKKASVEVESDRACAVIGCDKPVRSKGYCGAHYQKYANLRKTGRAEEFGWTDDAPPHSVTNPSLPRGRAGANAKAEAMGAVVDSGAAQESAKAVPPRIRRASSK